MGADIQQGIVGVKQFYVSWHNSHVPVPLITDIITITHGIPESLESAVFASGLTKRKQFDRGLLPGSPTESDVTSCRWIVYLLTEKQLLD